MLIAEGSAGKSPPPSPFLPLSSSHSDHRSVDNNGVSYDGNPHSGQGHPRASDRERAVLGAEIQIKKAEPTRISLSPVLSALINLIARQRKSWQQTESLSSAAQPRRFPPKYRWFTPGGLKILRLWLWICNQPGKKSGFLCCAESNLPGQVPSLLNLNAQGRNKQTCYPETVSAERQTYETRKTSCYSGCEISPVTNLKLLIDAHSYSVSLVLVLCVRVCACACGVQTLERFSEATHWRPGFKVFIFIAPC